MKIKIITLLLVISTLFLVSCSSNENKDIVNYEKITMENVPVIEEIKKLNDKDIYILEQQLENISIVDAEKYFENELSKYINSIEKVELKNVEIQKDNLTLVKGKNKKSLDNLIFKLNITIDSSNMVGSAEYAEKISQKLLDKFWEYSYFAMKAKKLYIVAYDLNGYKIYDRESTFTDTEEVVYKEQQEEEYFVQTLAFDYDNSELQLQKFGIIGENKELYIEYYVDDSYFEINEIEEKIDNLETISNDIEKYLMKNEKATKYINNNNIELLTISFNSGNLDNNYLTFNYNM